MPHYKNLSIIIKLFKVKNELSYLSLVININ
jgi:hypothetical protein